MNWIQIPLNQQMLLRSESVWDCVFLCKLVDIVNIALLCKCHLYFAYIIL